MQALLLILLVFSKSEISNKIQYNQAPSSNSVSKLKRITLTKYKKHTLITLATIVGLFGFRKGYKKFSQRQSINNNRNTLVSTNTSQSSCDTTLISTRQETLHNVLLNSVNSNISVHQDIYETDLTLRDCFDIENTDDNYLRFKSTYFLNQLINFTGTQDIFAETDIIIHISNKRHIYNPILLSIASRLLERMSHYETRKPLTTTHNIKHLTQLILSLHSLLYYVYSYEHTNELTNLPALNPILNTAFTFNNLIATFHPVLSQMQTCTNCAPSLNYASPLPTTTDPLDHSIRSYTVSPTTNTPHDVSLRDTPLHHSILARSSNLSDSFTLSDPCNESLSEHMTSQQFADTHNHHTPTQYSTRSNSPLSYSSTRLSPSFKNSCALPLSPNPLYTDHSRVSPANPAYNTPASSCNRVLYPLGSSQHNSDNTPASSCNRVLYPLGSSQHNSDDALYDPHSI